MRSIRAWSTALLLTMAAKASPTHHQPWTLITEAIRSGAVSSCWREGLSFFSGTHPTTPLTRSNLADFAFISLPVACSQTKAETSGGLPTSLGPKLSPLPAVAHRRRRHLQMSGVILSTDGSSDDSSAFGGVSLWLDMRTALLPASATLKNLYDELRQRELALGRSPEDPDWSLGRVPNPVSALLYAADPEERAADEMVALGAALPCFQLSPDSDKVLEVPSGEVVGVGLDPLDEGGPPGTGNGAAMAIVAAAAAQQGAEGSSFVFLRGVKPSSWEDEDMATVLRIAASTCICSGKTLVVTVQSVRQLHDSAMAALAASQTRVLGQAESAGGGGVVLLIEPMAELWEAGLMYL